MAASIWLKSFNSYSRLNVSKLLQTSHSTTKLVSSLHHSTNRTWKLSRYAKYLLLVPVLALPTVIYYPPNEKTVMQTIHGARRFIRSVICGTTISVDYWWSLFGLKEESAQYNEVIEGCHERSADRILEACLKNGGVYIKLGQGMVQMNHILPKAYLKRLSVLFDKALFREEHELDEIFHQEFECSPEVLFKTFDREPVAAASLAQVFKAETWEGEKVAVKVQYIDLQDRFHSDCDTVASLVRLIKWMHPNFNFVWVMDYLRVSLAQELDFINEGKNMESTRMDLKVLPFVYIPKVHWEKTTKRILTQEFIEGIKISETEKLKHNGLTIEDVDEKLVKMFAQQIFITGRIHADPHPGNVFVRLDKKGKAQIVLLDHGLYELLPMNSQYALCNLWKSIIVDDKKGMEKYSLQLGVEDHRMFCELLMQRPLKRSHNHFSNKLNPADSNYMKVMVQKRFDKVIDTIRSLPLNMLLVFRNINTIRAIVQDHGHRVDRYSIMALVAAKGAFNNRLIMEGRKKYLTASREYLYFRWKLCLSNLRFRWTILCLKFMGWMGRVPNYQEIISLLR